MDVAKRYSSNLGSFSREELERIQKKRVCVVGCGGLGGHVCGDLARFGVGALTVIDGDSFSEENLNRQLFATYRTLGQNKALVCAQALAEINRELQVTAYPVMLDEDNAAAVLSGCDVAVDCLDSVPARRRLARHCRELGLPLIHGAVSGLFGQVACVMPGDDVIELLYPEGAESPRGSLGNPIFSPALIAAIQSCEAVKLLAGREPGLRSKLLCANLLSCDFETVSLQ